MKLYLFDPRENTSGIYRLKYPAWVLEDKGIAKVAHGDEFLKRADGDKKVAAKNILGALSWCDAVIAQMSDNPANVELFKLARDMGKPVIMDVDDTLDMAADKAGQLWPERNRDNWERQKKVWPYISAITATCESLGHHFGEMFDKPYYVLPNMIDVGNTRWQFSRPEMRYACVGWMGCHTHKEDLRIVKPLIERLSDEQVFEVELQGYVPADLFENPDGGVAKRVISQGYVDHEKYPFRMSVFDIGLVPLVNEPFNDIGKSDLKFLEYSMAGAATIASKVGQYRTTITNRANGLLVGDDPEEWYEAVQYLKDDSRREKIIREAQRFVTTKRNIFTCYGKWARVYEQEIERARKVAA